MVATPRIAKQAEVHGEALNSPRQFFGVFRYGARALELLWSTSRPLAIFLGFCTILAGVLPSGVAYVGARIVDSVVDATKTHAAGADVDITPVLLWVLAEALILVFITAAHRGITFASALLKAAITSRPRV